MLAHLAQASRRPARSWLSLVPSRQYAVKSDGGPEDPFKQGPTYAQWLRNEGLKFKDPVRAKNWLGGQVPFPLNPSFKPPAPISDAIRTAIWNEYNDNPTKADVRTLAQRYGLSIARVDAILRLKGLEEHWRKQKKQLQTGFLKGMEFSLGVSEKKPLSAQTSVLPGARELGEDTVAADELSEATKDIARARYQRLFWEPVVEGQTPMMNEVLSKASIDGANSSKSREAALLKRLRHLKFETNPDVVLERPGRPTIRFVDVGVKFVDVKDRLKRVQAAKRRTLLKRRRRGVEAASSAQMQHDSGRSPVVTA
ncbi:eukaryotic mitochondrial regulator protein-domain-containing protein [Daedaleopsis nitida]|nr:eukaryotic mitochondrial regulator protein-domain-containing protein [Daedaleopsis nitida]